MSSIRSFAIHVFAHLIFSHFLSHKCKTIFSGFLLNAIFLVLLEQYQDTTLQYQTELIEGRKVNQYKEYFLTLVMNVCVIILDSIARSVVGCVPFHRVYLQRR